MKLKNRDIQIYHALFDEISNSGYEGIDFSFFVIKNKRLLKDRLDDINVAIKPSERFIEYEQKRIPLLTECSSDELGNVITEDKGNGYKEYIIQESHKEKWEEEIEKLKNEYQKDIDEYSSKRDERESFLDKEVDDLILKTINKTSLPKNLKISHLDAIFDLVIDVD